MTVRQTLVDSQRNDLKTDTYWAKRLGRIIAIEADQLPFIKLGNEVSIPKRQGNTKYTIRRYNKLPVNITPLVEGVAPEALKMSGTKVTGEIHQYGALIKITDVADDVHMDNLREVYQENFANHANEMRERIILATLDAEASEWVVGGLAAPAAGNVLTFEELRQIDLSMKVNLRKGHKAAGGKTITVVSPQVMQDLLDDPKLLSHMLLTGNDNLPIKNGSLRNYQVYGLVIQEAMVLAEAAVFSDATTVYQSYMLGEDGYNVITMGDTEWKEVGFTADSADPLGQTSSIGYKFWVGAKVVDPVAVIKILSVSDTFGAIHAGKGIGAGDKFNVAADQT